MSRRVVIARIWSRFPVRKYVQAFWENIKEGKSGIKKLSLMTLIILTPKLQVILPTLMESNISIKKN